LGKKWGEKFFKEKFFSPFLTQSANFIPVKQKKRRTHRYDHISLLHFCPGEVLQELVARRRRKGSTPAPEYLAVGALNFFY